MGEIIKSLINTLGLTVYMLGIITNLNNWLSLALGAVGFGFGIIKLLHAREVWLMKRIDRKEREDKYKFGKP